MKKLIAFLLPFILFISFYITSCTSTDRDKAVDTNPVITPTKTGGGSVTWISNTKSIGGSHPDTLLVKYSPRDCTYAPFALMLVSTTGGSHPDTTFVERVVPKPRKK
jgi:hypothetical protein